ncbi:tRNA (adenosine(37)-N6)-dimethylallyltransferase MiaA [Paenibacillus polymyxa]|uniref:tRNA (adenosine(37)-N6)-dimethylallyltransferase MiaA n=1 Tax=Paenibacillus TaxID=44249 RepID=UPI000E3D46E2|nr:MULTISPECIES: tRNA (adenosine(37)-N6)-dimethylallyltransferase MiaA [Paenibacillus]KAF6658647.1 tRNA (adenosine(37)-N6)-dimethylallyltransferase MiaA [Paenibacillus sp. EKM301P]RFT96773.1 tRNA (adenosine(37)-N6)-dimethylallyltransferase MiaA [Paenibacillus jamilae]RPE02395.1 tRNA (adenosine(37)-N6)-dimethylallyltransferase MiaA [Paenibacillus polymyxa]UBS85176.1 tRNA (adenosine(37)-N6)-dimethylallyltransferase MiaA [Paenibacillus polymyxa]WHX33688.1 tRNA (adenosine(37)-N6)-dimethylallyltran
MTVASKPKLLVLVGPTAVGKTKLSIEMARQFDAEIISGDSMQVYRHMDIGTAKISKQEMKGIKHHLIDIHEPEYPYSVAQFQEDCRRLIPDIQSRGKLPFIVGGTGLYVESVCYEYQFSEVGADEAFRQEQLDYADQYGADALHARLQAVDPESALRLHPNDRRRVVRALEIYHVSGTTLSSQLASQKKESPYQLCIVGLTMDRQMLYKRIEDRIDGMLDQGLVAEVTSLMERGVRSDAISMQGLGYKEISSYLRGEVSLEEAVTWLKRDTRHFAKRQLSWFRHMKDIQWVDVTDFENFSAHAARIHEIIAGKFRTDLEYTSKQSK